jgi:post-segregation antitoxin (ccd killing protein)
MRTHAQSHIRVSLYLDAELVRKARDLGLNLSKVAENAIRRAVEALDSFESAQKGVARGRFELPSGGPKPPILVP